MTHTARQGFTVPELLVTLLVMGVLLGLALVFVHQKDFGPELRDAQRSTDLAQLMQVFKKYHADHDALPPGLTDQAQVLGSVNGELDLCKALVPHYLKDMPIDPLVGTLLNGKNCTVAGSSYSSGYAVRRAADGTVTLGAPTTETADPLTLTYRF